ncbi:MAG: hypothetical protein KF764_14420 [Labilithrix sp.]|nr:hypothetical protein [Labilithrix sp.]
MSVRLGLVTVLVLASALSAAACTTYRDQLARGQLAFEQNDHDRTLAILRDLEPDLKRLTPPEQASYAYLRGMSDYRIGYKADARHWLSVARAHEESSPGVLPADWKARTNETLDQLNDLVFSQGTSALPTSRGSDSDDAHAVAGQAPVPKGSPAGKKHDKKKASDASKGVPADSDDASPPP